MAAEAMSNENFTFVAPLVFDVWNNTVQSSFGFNPLVFTFRALVAAVDVNPVE